MMQNIYNTAKGLESLGRGNDSMLIHMTPKEVSGLQALAMAKGGSLTVNPNTGLPEAGFLEDILPTILGFGLNFIPGVGPIAAAGITGLGTAALTGDLQKGLMAGLGAFGGASLGSGLGFGVDAAAKTGVGAGLDTVAKAGADAANTGAQSAINAGVQGAANTGAQSAVDAVSQNIAKNIAQTAAKPSLMQSVLGPNMGGQVDKFGQGFSQAASGAGNPISATRTGLAALGVANPILNAMQPTYSFDLPNPADDWNYPGVQRPPERSPRFKPANTMGDTSEFSYFGNTNPMRTYADGGMVLPEDSFIIDARTVSELGNGSSGAGQEYLANYGGVPIQGPGDGVSDSIPASISGVMPARVARDEVMMPPQAVARLGGGDVNAGARRLYALMHQAEIARKRTDRGRDNELKKVGN